METQKEIKTEVLTIPLSMKKGKLFYICEYSFWEDLFILPVLTQIENHRESFQWRSRQECQLGRGFNLGVFSGVTL